MSRKCEVCSAPRLILTLLELDSELIDGLSRRDVFFRLDRNGPWPLPANWQDQLLRSNDLFSGSV